MGAVATVTISGTNFSVYGLTSDALTDANGYFTGRLGASAWNDASDDDKKRGLVSATRWIDRVSQFSGTKTVAGQALAWPRDNATCDGTAITDGTVPDELALAAFELALILLGDPAQQGSSGTGSNVRRAKAGSAEVEFFAPTLGSSSDTRLPVIAHDLLRCLFAGTSSIDRAFAYGADVDSTFDADDQYDLSGGWA